jgi:hypothetical protein
LIDPGAHLTSISEDDADEALILFGEFTDRLEGLTEEFSWRALGRQEYVRQREQLAAALAEVTRFGESLRNAG